MRKNEDDVLIPFTGIIIKDEGYTLYDVAIKKSWIKSIKKEICQYHKNYDDWQDRYLSEILIFKIYTGTDKCYSVYDDQWTKIEDIVSYVENYKK